VAHILSMPLQAAMRIQVPYACVTRLHIYHHEAEPDVMSLDFHNGQLK
jgi:Lhr-like helicase